MENLWLILISAISYLLGSIPFSYLVAKKHGKNLFEIGSKNIGTANVYRATGKIDAPILALIGDMGKGAVAIFLCRQLSFLGYNLSIGMALAAFFVVLGHNWPLFLKFKGGKGLASLAGILLALNWKLILIALGTLGFSIIIVELILKKELKLEGNFKKKFKKLFSIFISQIIGRMIGLVGAIIAAYFFDAQTLLIIFPAVVLSLIKHIKRTKRYVETIKK